jgi:quercetin dioxygenase-like cupin family protein
MIGAAVYRGAMGAITMAARWPAPRQRLVGGQRHRSRSRDMNMPMKEMGMTISLAILTFVALSAQATQKPAVIRTVLQQFDTSVPGREAVTARAEIPAGGTTGPHTHPGEEISYLLEGSVLLEVEGAPPRTLKAGDVFFIPAGKVHNATPPSGKTIIIANYIVEKGKPLATPAK